MNENSAKIQSLAPDPKRYLDSHLNQFSMLIMLTSKVDISLDDINEDKIAKNTDVCVYLQFTK